MLRISTLFFCLLLAAAAVGRYKAEANVRADKAEIRSIESQIAAEEQKISELKLQVEVLESGPRLAQLASHRLDLVPARSAQLADARKFAMLIEAGDAATIAPRSRGNGDFIINAIAMADFGQPDTKQ